MKCIPIQLVALLLGLCRAQRQVQMQEGPLIRSEGYHTTIWCNVSGYSGTTEQNFEWSIYLPSAPTRQIQIISTNDPGYPYTMYGDRVQNKEVYVERIDRDSAQLHITNLKLGDAGEYECHTPNTESTYWGSYNAKGNLTVIPDTLRATSVAQELNKVEGDSLELVCEVSEQTPYHTHVAVTWYLQKADQSLKVISLTRDFILRSGESYRQRQTSGDVRLDKTGATSYRLTIYRLQPFDQGTFYCEAREWIQDPDKSWYTIATKPSDRTTVNVKATDKNFSVHLENEKKVFTVGESLELRCVLVAQNIQDRYFSVLWIYNGTQIVNIGRNAVPTVHADYTTRERLGYIRFAKETDTTYLLKIYHLQVGDSGKYHCRATEHERTVTGDFIGRDTNKSTKHLIIVLPVKSSLNVTVTSNTTKVLEGGMLQFVCNVNLPIGNHNRLSITWQMINKRGQAIDVISREQDGTQVIDTSYHKRGASGDLRLVKQGPGSFVLQLHNAAVSDDGEYICTMAEWISSAARDWQRVGKQSARIGAVVTPLESGFSVTAITRTPSVTYGNAFELQCFIRPNYPSWVSVSWRWKFQSSQSGNIYDMVTFARDTSIIWGNKVTNFKSKTMITKTPNNVRLNVSKASDLEAGRYQCIAELWHQNQMEQWVRKAEKSSNILEVKVKPPDARLEVSQLKRNLVVTENDNIRLSCVITNQTSTDSQFSVQWYVQRSQEEADRLILRSNRDCMFEYGNELLGHERKERLQAAKTSSGHYTLVIHKADVDDSGKYYCLVQEWLLSPNNNWYKVGINMSGLTYVTVQRPDNNLQTVKTERAISVPENGQIRLDCKISNRTNLDSQLSVVWFAQNSLDTDEYPIFSLNRNSVFQYGSSKDNMMRLRNRLQYEKPTNDLYSLILQKATISDTGSYYCNVEEWAVDPNNMWYKLGEDQSGLTTVTVQQPEFKMQLDKTELNITVSEKDLFQLSCNVTQQTQDNSRFAVYWFAWKVKEDIDGIVKETILKVDHNSVFGFEALTDRAKSMKDRLQFERPSNGLYTLTIHNSGRGDTGNYYCNVEEWIQNANNIWYKLGEDESGLLTVTVQSKGSTLHQAICSNDALFYFIFFYPFPIFGVLLIAILLTRYKTLNAQKKSDAKNGVPLLWIKEPAVTYSPTSLEPPDFRIGPGSIA
ncbi:LOW QUALITY PROTEIN: immunoglobulin superfamily member 3-like [Leucoraja erinacea]|uniref:LOW QUALITY PROTEIN: immunoglobulin superfamily member 3-like n=1 Tax=Leucoraja erinaceus TaxID=7782 RepID=UPI0024583A04|nr:LOW QUALITY PROTEIN: immunoglobulin superfamily member 3-like [Leucoraja erinacea]